MDLSKREKTISATQWPPTMSSCCLAPLWKILTGAPSHKFAASVFPKCRSGCIQLSAAFNCQLHSAASRQPPAKKRKFVVYCKFSFFRKKRKKIKNGRKFSEKTFCRFSRKEGTTPKTDVVRVAQAMREKMVILLEKIYLRLH